MKRSAIVLILVLSGCATIKTRLIIDATDKPPYAEPELKLSFQVESTWE